jgi:4-amino-4-deoxy-L-arabinose transferase-like glycosyltransferase
MNTSEIFASPSPTATQAITQANSRATSTTHALRVLVAVAVLLLLYRIVLMWLLPLADTTEARYGEIARLTVTHGFWLMPHIDPQTPFFAKPPLSTWVAAASMSLFGLNEFAARLPSLLASIATVLTAMAFASALQVKRRWLVLPVLASCPLFFISAGAVMTDAVQMCIVIAALYAAWRAIDDDAQQRRPWQLFFWIMVGIGALSKGLADWALIGLPLISYALLEGRPLQLFKRLFNWSGVCIAVCIFVPWYAAAEHFYPGFLHYFIVGEHFSRFLIPGWKGDRYGIAHQQPLGTIWIFWVAAMLPWTGVFVTEFVRFAARVRSVPPLERFLWCATLAPLVFFTFAHNIIWTYGLTAVVPFSVLVARWLERASDQRFRIASYALLLLSLAAVAAAPILARNVKGNSDRDLVAAFHRVAPADAALIYRVAPIYSPHFYAPGQVRYQPQDAAAPATSQARPQFLVIANHDLDSQPAGARLIFKGTRHSLVEEK